MDESRPTWIDFFQTHRKWLASVIYLRVSDRHAVEEVLQETALAAVNSVPVALSHEHISKWLYRVAVRQSLLYRRRLGREKRKNENAFCSPAASESVEPDPLSLLVAMEQRGLVRESLDCLPPRDAELLLFKYGENLTCAQIASRLGATESAVKSRLLRARKKLAAEIEYRNK